MTDSVNSEKNCYYGFDLFIEQSNEEMQQTSITESEMFIGNKSRRWDITCSKNINTTQSSGLFFTAKTGTKLSKKR